MSEDRYIPGVPCWVDIAPPDPDAAAAFYGGLFGWEIEDVMPPGAPRRYLMARLGGGDVAAIASPGDRPAAWRTYVWVDDADETARKVRDAGGSVLDEPVDAGDFGRMAEFADPAGAPFRVWQANQQRGAAVVNEHGSVNFNDLHTTDLEGAARFYGAVFGWDLLNGSMWALPAYGDFLERRRPGTREGMASMGAPPRFEEVVASAGPVADGDAPDWGVTFGVDDADAIAARAAELGGTVVTPPHDAPWVRTAVIRDPQGATLTASQFVPENKG
jgi:predicted enzyme related to lactoylglutathione lyase